MLSVFWLVLDYACNNRCLACYAEQKGFKMARMGYKYARYVIETMAAAGAKKCLLIGGEPTLHPDLEKIISYASEKDVRTTLITNGRKLKDKDYFSRLLSAGLTKSVISIEGSVADVHDVITQAKSFHETISAFENAIGLGCKFCSLTTIQQGNADDCIRIPIMLHDLGVEEIAFNCGIPSVGQSGSNADHVLSPDRIAGVIQDVYTRAKKDGIAVEFNATIPACLFPEDVLGRMLIDKALVFGCQMYYGRGAAFDPSGNILPCTHFAEFPILKNCLGEDGSFRYMGDILGPWEELEGSPARFRKELWRYPSEHCSHCRYWGGCIGGCPVFWSYFDPRDYIVPRFPLKGGEINGCN